MNDLTAMMVPCDTYLKDDRTSFLEFIYNATGGIEYKTFPMIFQNGRFIGGYMDFVKQYESTHAFAMSDDF
jgi:glutaredoxin